MLFSPEFCRFFFDGGAHWTPPTIFYQSLSFTTGMFVCPG